MFNPACRDYSNVLKNKTSSVQPLCEALSSYWYSILSFTHMFFAAGSHRFQHQQIFTAHDSFNTFQFKVLQTDEQTHKTLEMVHSWSTLRTHRYVTCTTRHRRSETAAAQTMCHLKSPELTVSLTDKNQRV